MVAALRLVLLAGITLGAAQDVLLPKPAAPYNVSIRTSELIDRSRVENSPNAPPGLKEPRRMMVSMFSPVTRDTEACRSPYMLPKAAAVQNAYWQNASAVHNASNLFVADFNRFKLHACSHDVTYGLSHKVDDGSAHESRFPLLIFSPGYGATRFYYSVLAQYVAAAGFVVATIDHPYSVDVIEFPDGSVVTADQNPPDGTPLSYYYTHNEIRVQDIRFLADQLAHNTTFRKLIYPTGVCHSSTDKIGGWGHSLGGSLAFDLILEDERFKAGINLDGGFFGNAPNTTIGIDQPFVLWQDGNAANRSDVPNWEDSWNNMHGFKRNPRLAGSRHLTFGDPLLLADSYPFNRGAFADSNISGQRAIEILSRYTRDFFRFALEGTKPGLINGPSKEYPEVTFDP